jgi:dTDP-4-amino-4,6-dideoxygalactose transaminase
LESGVLVHGKKCKEFEKQFAGYIGTKYAISMNSCTSALQLAIEALKLKGEIIVPSFTFTASANAIVLAGCKPVFADVDYNTRNLDPLSVKNKITNNTVGVMPVHFGGQSCDMDELMSIAKKYDLSVIEDSAETIGGTFNGKRTGSFGDAGCFSFFPTKNLTTGEGGIVTTDNKEVYDYISLKIAHGIKKDGFRRDCITPGYNMRMTDIQGAIGLIQLKKLDEMNNRRREVAKFYNKKIQSIKEVAIPQEHKSCKHVYQMYTITVDKNRRDFLVKKLNENGIGASVHFDPPVHKQTYYTNREFDTTGLKITEKLSGEIITLPMFPDMTNEQVEFITKNIK